MPSAQQQAWTAACERGHGYIIPGGATKWRRVERADQLKELEKKKFSPPTCKYMF